MTRKFNYWIVIGQDNCMRCRQLLTDCKVNFVMGDLCQECFFKNAFIMWVDDYDEIEYIVESYELMTGLHIDILEKIKKNLKPFNQKEWFNDFDAHRVWRMESQILVHCLHNKFTAEILKVVKSDELLFVLGGEICGIPGKGGFNSDSANAIETNSDQPTLTPWGDEYQTSGSRTADMSGVSDSLSWLLH